jgi:hypothetical protein
MALYESWLHAEPRLCGAISRAISSSASKSGSSGKMICELHAEDEEVGLGGDDDEDAEEREATEREKGGVRKLLDGVKEAKRLGFPMRSTLRILQEASKLGSERSCLVLLFVGLTWWKKRRRP